MDDQAPMDLRAIDHHTVGEPFRIVVSDVGEIAGATVRERRETAAAAERIDRVRRLLCHEPWAVRSGRVAAPADGEVDVVIDVPSGRVTARAARGRHGRGGRRLGRGPGSTAPS